MHRGMRLIAIAGFLFTIASPSAGTSNLNLSKSNLYRLTCSTDLVSSAQAAAMLADLDKLGLTDEARLKLWLPANFRRFGIAPERVKKLLILPAGKVAPQTTIILLTDPADEARAIATTVKSSKSNSSD